MAAKKGSKKGSKKSVTVTIDEDVLRHLSAAVAGLHALAKAADMGAGDPKLQRELLRVLKKGR